MGCFGIHCLTQIVTQLKIYYRYWVPPPMNSLPFPSSLSLPLFELPQCSLLSLTAITEGSALSLLHAYPHSTHYCTTYPPQCCNCSRSEAAHLSLFITRPNPLPTAHHYFTAQLTFLQLISGTTHSIRGNYRVVREHNVSKLTLYSRPIKTNHLAKQSDII